MARVGAHWLGGARKGGAAVARDGAPWVAWRGSHGTAGMGSRGAERPDEREPRPGRAVMARHVWARPEVARSVSRATGHQGYVSTEDAMNRPEWRQAVPSEALSQLSALRCRYGHLKELSGVWDSLAALSLFEAA